MSIYFDQYKDLRIKGLQYILNNSELNENEKSKLRLLIKATDQCVNIPELGAVMSLPTPNANFGFFPIEPLTNPDPKAATCMKFGGAPLAWYFLYGQYSHVKYSVCYTLMIFKMELACPDVVSKSEFLASDAAVWSLSGGVGIRDRQHSSDEKTNWYSIPFNICRGKYKCGKNNTFSLSFNTDDVNYLQIFEFKSTQSKRQRRRSPQDEVTAPRNFSVNLKFKTYPDANFNNKCHPIKIRSSFNSEIEPSFNGPNGCVPCIGGVGSNYWSYTRMSTSLSLKIPELQADFKNGLGWFDHQWMQGDYIPNGFVRFLNKLKKPKTIRWIWLNLQFFESQTQWMISEMVDGPLTVGTVIDQPGVVNLYDGKGAHYALSEKDIKCSVEVMEVSSTTSFINKRSMYFPCKYRIGLSTKSDEKMTYYIMRRDFGSGGVYLPSGNLNIECSGSLWNASETLRVGNCFFESNQFQSLDELIETPMEIAGYTSADDLSVFM